MAQVGAESPEKKKTLRFTMGPTRQTPCVGSPVATTWATLIAADNARGPIIDCCTGLAGAFQFAAILAQPTGILPCIIWLRATWTPGHWWAYGRHPCHLIPCSMLVPSDDQLDILYPSQCLFPPCTLRPADRSPIFACPPNPGVYPCRTGPRGEAHCVTKTSI